MAKEDDKGVESRISEMRYVLRWKEVGCYKLIWHELPFIYKGTRVSRLTVASQHTRTSYRWPGVRSTRRNQELTPRGAFSDGNDASRCFLIDGVDGESASRSAISISGDGDCDGCEESVGGATKIVFSTLASDNCTSAERSKRRSNMA